MVGILTFLGDGTTPGETLFQWGARVTPGHIVVQGKGVSCTVSVYHMDCHRLNCFKLKKD